MLSDAQRALIAERLRRGRTDSREGAAPEAVAPRGDSIRLVDLTGGGADSASGDRPARPLFLVHAVGGTVHPYVPLATRLAEDFTAYGIEAAGLAAGSAPAASLDAMVEAYLASIRSGQPEGGPYRLAGWSLGGLVAYELARRLESDGEKVEALVLLDPPFAMSADLGDAGSAADGAATEDRIAAWFVADAAQSLGESRDVAEAPDPATHSAAEQLDWLAARLTAGAGGAGSAAKLTEAVRTEMGRRFAVFQAHTRLIAGYRPSASLHTRTLLISAGHSPNAAVVTRWLALLDQDSVTVRTIDSDHYAFLRAPLVTRVAEWISAWQGAR